jgi:hypothetical protein
MSVSSTGRMCEAARSPLPIGRRLRHRMSIGRPDRATIVAPGQVGGPPACW